LFFRKDPRGNTEQPSNGYTSREYAAEMRRREKEERELFFEKK